MISSINPKFVHELINYDECLDQYIGECVSVGLVSIVNIKE